MDVDDDKLESEPERQSKKNKPSGSTKRKRAHLAEVSRWKTKDVTAPWQSKCHANIHCKADSTMAASDPEDDSDCTSGLISVHRVNINWPEEAHYTPVVPGARNLSIKDQPLPMKRMIHASVNHVTDHFLFESAYPATNQAEYETFHCDVFVHCAKCLGYHGINKCLKEDYELVKLCAHVINGRVSLLHTQTKGITDKKVEGFYQLITSIQAEKHMKDLTNEDQNYIYPLVEPLTQTAHTIIHKYQGCFGSTIMEGPKKDKMELPIVMVCVIATSTHASLDNWSQGYKGHEIFLTTLKAERPDFFHKLISGLYDAIGTSIKNRGKDSALIQYSLEAMVKHAKADSLKRQIARKQKDNLMAQAVALHQEEQSKPKAKDASNG
ncbi:hypothetical protein HYPSUDRAFT_209810 [Hypholoma sublateritium FD-334 SS-4]|uniref:DUF6532 domain-containing protein n=1 Tax=Hypholoma sublateritium (strain FD-334 SS-4) TaxID=945553 RepID=A0A0D2NX93_HYPSF|nr:hypothetical protein HYPSUDRAFT_209810 [Hypholoma sublateritium FD-334 SS-4]